MVGPVNPLHPRRSGRSRPSVMTVLRQSTLRVAGVGLTWLYTLYRVHPAVWRLMARNYRPWMGRFARLHAWMTCQFAWLDVPAYGAHLQRGGWEFRWFRLGSYPPTNKQNYVAAFPEEQRCRCGELEIEGSVVDESSGSSGRPFNWVRSRRELRSVHKNLAGFTTMVFPGRRRFVINAYSMGAWATGTNTGIAMARIAMVKNTGPDLAKITDTLQGYRWHKVYYEFPFTLGTIAFFSDRDALLTFARSRHHRHLMCWVTDHGTRNATGGYIRLYAAEPDGYSNGVWRAEGPTMAHIPTFTPLAREAEGPPVHRR
jgi:hypothetical protein